MKVQGKDILVTVMHAHITTFEVKLRLSESQLADGLLVEPDTCASVVAFLMEKFASRFAGVRPLAADFKLFTAPLTFPRTTQLPPADGIGGATVQ